MEVDTARTLILDHTYRPVEVVGWQRAITLFFQQKCEIVESYDGFVRSTSIVIKIPAVVRLFRAFRRARKPVKFSRINVLARDNYTCQYCGDKKPIRELTYDHIVPKSRGGATSWTNIVAACSPCNRKKNNRTPDEAGMKLRKQPKQPVTVPVITIEVSRDNAPDAWRDWVYWTVPLEA